MSAYLDDFADYDWSNDTLLTVIDCAQQGIPTAIKEYERRQKELELPPLATISGKAQTKDQHLWN